MKILIREIGKDGDRGMILTTDTGKTGDREMITRETGRKAFMGGRGRTEL